MKVLKQKNILEKFITNAEAYLESCQISKMEILGLTIFAKKLHHRFPIGFLCNGRRYLKVKQLFQKFKKYLGKKLSWSTVLVKL